MELPQQIRDRLNSNDVPDQVYALVGASLVVRNHLTAAPDQARSKIHAARATKDRWVTTAYQAGYETRDRVGAVPHELKSGLRVRWTQFRGLPVELREEAAERVIDLRDGTVGQYSALAASGERALTQWHAERLLNERADRVARAVTPGAARASVSAREAARKAAASPTGQRAGEAGRRARQSAKKAWVEYLAAADEAGAARLAAAGVQDPAGATQPPATGSTSGHR